MNFRRRSAPVSTLRTRLQQRLAEKNNWEYKNDFNLEEAKPDPGSLSPAAIFKTMHRYFLVKITVALIVVFVTALFIQGGQSSAEPLLQALRFVVEWNMEPAALSGKVAPAFRLFWENAEIPVAGRSVTDLPFAGAIMDGFGMHNDSPAGRYGMHYGIDLAAPQGTVVRAIHGGRVEQVEIAAGGSDFYTVVIDVPTDWSMIYRGVTEVAVKEGETVEPGTQLGILGPPRLYDMPHLHFELRFKGRPVPPPGDWLAQWEQGEASL